MDFDGAFFNVDDFELTDTKLGKGAFGKVFVVRNISDGKKYAAKIINIDKRFSGDEQMMFLRESLILRNLHHPAIIKFIGINFQGFTDSRKLSPTIITEYMKNGSLKSVLDKEKKSIADLEWTPTKKYISLLGISNAMKYLHEHNILHRDLKPENVLVDENFYPYIADFGLSRCFPETLSKTMQITMTKNIGTPIYMAPEMLEEEEDSQYGTSIDVYAFGILAYEIVTGNQPYSELGKISAVKLVKKIISGYRPPISSDVPKKMKSLITRCLSKSPRKRPSFKEIFTELSNDFSYFDEDVDEDQINQYLEYLENGSKKDDNESQKLLVSSKNSDSKVNEDNTTELIENLKEKMKEEREKYTDIIQALVRNCPNIKDITIDTIFTYAFIVQCYIMHAELVT